MVKQEFRFIGTPDRFKEICNNAAQSGGFAIEFQGKDFLLSFKDVLPPYEMPLPEDFPIPNTEISDIYNFGKDFIDKFPNCCEKHKKLIGQTWFRKSEYEELPMKLAKQFYYTIRLIGEREKDENWYKDITNYIDANVLSFGRLPDGFGNPVGVNFYVNCLYYWIDKFKHFKHKITDKDKKQLLKFIDETYYNVKEDTSKIDLNLLFTTYQKWLNLFPFNTEYFKAKKAHFSKVFPMFRGKLEYNKYTGTFGGIPNTQEGLIEFLTKITTELLKSVNSAEMLKKGAIADINKHQIDLNNETHRIKQTTLLNEFSNSERKYADLLATWLQNEKDYFLGVETILQRKPEVKEPTATEKWQSIFEKHGFFDIPKVKSLTQSKQSNLVQLISENKLPYGIAMFDFLGYLDYLGKQHFDSNDKLNRAIAKWYNPKDKDGRGVKGNRSVLNPKSTEKKERYTAHTHIENVKYDYKNLK